MRAPRQAGLLAAAVLASGLLATVTGPAAGQEVPDLTLEDALSIARASNPAYRQASGALDLNAVEGRATWATQVLPTIDLNLFRTGYGGTLTRRATDFFGNPIENPESDWVYNSSTSQGLSLSWSIQGTSVLDAISRQSRTNTDRELQLVATGWTVEAQVRSLFFDALEQRELLAVEEAIGESRRVDYESAQRLFAIAQRSRVDVLTAELQVEQQRVNTQQQLRRYEQALLALRTYLGDPSLGDFRVADEGLPIFDPTGLDAEALVERAERANPGLRQAQSSVAGARLGVREARRNWFPTLNLSYNLGRLAQTRQADAFMDVTPEEGEIQSSFNVFLSIPAFNNYFNDRAEVARAQVELDSQEESFRESRLEIERQVRTELINLDNQYRTLTLAGRSLEIAGEAVRLAREEYRLGTRTFEQLQEAVTQEADARRQVIQARFGFVDALLALEEAVGARIGVSGAEGG